MNHLTRLVVLTLLPLAAAAPAVAQDAERRGFSLDMPSDYRLRLTVPRSDPRDPLDRLAPALPRVIPDYEERPFGFLPEFGAGGNKTDRRGLSFGLRPGKSPKAIARFRF